MHADMNFSEAKAIQLKFIGNIKLSLIYARSRKEYLTVRLRLPPAFAFA